MKTFKNIKTLLSGFFLAGTLLLSGCPGAEGGIDLPATSGGGNSGRTGVPEALQLNYINVFYANDSTRQNLISFNSQSGEFKANDVDELKGAIAIEAEAKDPEVSILITWNNEGATGQKSGSMPSAEAGLATVENMPPPTGGYPLTVNVKTSKDTKSYTTVIALKAPGADASLANLFVTKADNTDTELLPNLGLGGEETFWPYVYDYAIVFKDAGDANAELKITAEAASADSVITLTQDGNIITNPTNPAPPNASAALLRGGDEDPETETETPEPSPAPASETEKRQYSWNVNVGKKGTAPSEIALTVENGDVINRYWILLVPPPDTTIEEAYLSLLNFRYGNGSPAITNFNANVQTYTVEAPQSETTVLLQECAAMGSGQAAITYKTVNRETGETVGGSEGTIAISSLPASLTLPIAGETELVVTVTVTVPAHADRTMIYTVNFRKSQNLSAYSGTYTLTVGGTATAATALVAVTADNAEHTATITKGTKNWSVAIDKELGAPVKFAVMYKTSPDDSISYRTSITAPGGKDGIILTFSVTGSSAGSGENNSLYVQTAAQLKSLEEAANKTQNYYLANDIDLTELDWTGPSDYSGKFNGNGKTIKLELSNKEGYTGLFNSLGDGAEIENLNVVVSTKADTDAGEITMTGASHFGGVIGLIAPATGSNSGSYRLCNIYVKGTLSYIFANTGVNFLLAGGLIGEINANLSEGGVIIENCGADINIKITDTNGSGIVNMVGAGGLVGKTGGLCTVRNSYTKGSIDITTNKDRPLIAGGITASVGRENGNAYTTLFKMENCYSEMTISISKTANSDNTFTAAGGLIGYYNNTNNNTKVFKSVAINPEVTAVGPQAAANRVIGNHVSGALENNYALDTMKTGTSAEGAVVSGGGAANGASGASKTPDDLKAESFWTNTLSFSESNWDFSGLSNGQYPTLKKKN
ncbi:MAG: hypothetical protein LBC27_08660 [Spirochaetaceae bacterium]|jgi:hypothetical protein|nr:hypothetical protein [Spirochaetaceae bacterium]